MPELTITPGSVAVVTETQFERFNAGVAIDAGDVMRLDSQSQWQLADNTGTTNADMYAIAVNSGGVGQEIKGLVYGVVSLGAVLTVGEVYVIGTTGGSMRPHSELTTGDFVTIVGVAQTTSNLLIARIPSGVAVP